MLFTDCIKNPESLALWARLASHIPDVTLDTKLESLEEIDHLMREIPHFNRTPDETRNDTDR